MPGADATVWDEDLDGDEKAPTESPEGLRHGPREVAGSVVQVHYFGITTAERQD